MMSNERISVFRGYRLLRQDSEWTKKLALLSLLVLSAPIIPLVGQIVMQGWLALLFRSVVNGSAPPLPPLRFNTDELGKLLGLGIKPFVVNVVWQLPIVLVAMVLGFGFYAMQLAVIFADLDEEVTIGLSLCLGSGMLLLLPLIVLLSVPAAVATVRAELADDFGAGFQVREIIAFSRRQLWTLLRGFLVLGVLMIVLMPVAMICTCYLGLFPLGVIMGLCSQVLLADVYLKDLAAGGTPWPTKD